MTETAPFSYCSHSHATKSLPAVPGRKTLPRSCASGVRGHGVGSGANRPVSVAIATWKPYGVVPIARAELWCRSRRSEQRYRDIVCSVTSKTLAQAAA